MIKNEHHINDFVSSEIRKANETRGLWYYELVQSAGKYGLDKEQFARAAIRKLGNLYRGGYPDTDSVPEFMGAFLNDHNIKQFHMELVSLTDDEAVVHFHYCPMCGKVIAKQTVDQMVDQIMELPERTKIQLLAPVVRGRKGTHAKLLDQARRSGYVRAEIDGNVYELSEEITLDKNIKHNIAIIVDRLIVKPGIEKRLTDSLETVLNLADGLAVVDTMDGNYMNFSQSFSCPDCGISIDEIEPRSFSFNNPFGACPQCLGLGYKMEFDSDLMIPDKSLSIAQGAITVMGWQSCTDKSSFTNAILNALCREYGFDLDTPFQDYPKKIQDILLYGTGGHSVKVYYKGQRGHNRT